MADTALQIQYRQSFQDGFEQRQTLLRDLVTTEAVFAGNQAKFLIADTGGARAVTRTAGGLIPSRPDNLTQPTITLREIFDKPIETNFNIFATQGGSGVRMAIMQKGTMGVVNREIDQDIITALNTATLNTGAAASGATPANILTMLAKARAILQNGEVPWDNQITALVTPAFESYLMIGVPQYASADYVNSKPFEDGGNLWSDRPRYRHWMGMNWVVHPNLPGAGTNAEKNFIFHRSAVGHAANVGGMSSELGYNEEHDYTFALTKIYAGAGLLNNAGVVVMNHDGSALVSA